MLLHLVVVAALTSYVLASKCDPDGVTLSNAINDRRQQHGLPRLPIVVSLSQTAQAHAERAGCRGKTNASECRSGCNLHSWAPVSGANWEPCCYTGNHANPQCMWNKPRELGTGYPGNGFEISYGSSGTRMFDPKDAVEGWYRSGGHRAVFMWEGPWKQHAKYIGCANLNGYAHCWFGSAVDPQGLCDSAINPVAEPTLPPTRRVVLSPTSGGDNGQCGKNGKLKKPGKKLGVFGSVTDSCMCKAFCRGVDASTFRLKGKSKKCYCYEGGRLKYSSKKGNFTVGEVATN